MKKILIALPLIVTTSVFAANPAANAASDIDPASPLLNNFSDNIKAAARAVPLYTRLPAVSRKHAFQNPDFNLLPDKDSLGNTSLTSGLVRPEYLNILLSSVHKWSEALKANSIEFAISPVFEKPCYFGFRIDYTGGLVKLDKGPAVSAKSKTRYTRELSNFCKTADIRLLIVEWTSTDKGYVPSVYYLDESGNDSSRLRFFSLDPLETAQLAMELENNRAGFPCSLFTSRDGSGTLFYFSDRELKRKEFSVASKPKPGHRRAPITRVTLPEGAKAFATTFGSDKETSSSIIPGTEIYLGAPIIPTNP